jgi:hypothetical protein
MIDIEKFYFFEELTKSHFYYFDSVEKLKAGCDVFEVDINLDDSFSGRCISFFKDDQSVIFIFSPIDKLPVLAHEVLHAALFTLERIGEPLHYDSEILPYLTEWLMNKCINMKENSENNDD